MEAGRRGGGRREGGRSTPAPGPARRRKTGPPRPRRGRSVANVSWGTPSGCWRCPGTAREPGARTRARRGDVAPSTMDLSIGTQWAGSQVGTPWPRGQVPAVVGGQPDNALVLESHGFLLSGGDEEDTKRQISCNELRGSVTPEMTDGSFLPEHQVHHPAAADMRTETAAVGQNVRVAAAGVLEGVGQGRHRGEVAGLVHGGGEAVNHVSPPSGLDPPAQKGRHDHVPHEGGLSRPFRRVRLPPTD